MPSGSLQARMSAGDPRLYNVNRDVAHNFGAVMEEVAARCEDARWPHLNALAKEHGVSDEEIGRACQALCRFVVVQLDTKGESMASCLARCGWLDGHPIARVVVIAYLGTVVLGAHWAGVREATLGGEGPVLTYGKLRWHGMRCAKLMAMPRWRRRWYLLRARFSRAWRAFRRPERYA